MTDANIILFTGAIQTGKTTWLQHWALGRNGVEGLLSPVINGIRHFYNIGQNQFVCMEATAQEADCLLIGKYRFLRQVFDHAAAELMAISKKTDWSYLIIDEIGPLELVQKTGLYNALLTVVESVSRPCTIIIVVRWEMLEKLKALLTDITDKHITVVKFDAMSFHDLCL